MKKAVLVYNIYFNRWNFEGEQFVSFIDGLLRLSKRFDIIGWCYFSEDKEILEGYIDANKNDFLPEMVTFGSVLFLENSEFLEALNPYFNAYSLYENKKFDSWRTRSQVGYISSSIVKELDTCLLPKSYKVSVAVLGYLSYKVGAIVSVSSSEKLCKKNISGLDEAEYIEFISYTKKNKWILFYSLTRLLFDKKLLVPIKYLLKKNYIKLSHKKSIWEKPFSSYKKPDGKTMDVLIPTLGRPEYVYQTLCDLNQQNFKINKIIIIEQKLPDQYETLLGKSIGEKWNFELEHYLLDEPGVCNARNIGFQKSKADYLVMFDDDIRIEMQPDLFKNLVKKIEVTKAQIVTFATNNIKGNTTCEMSYFISGGASLIRNENRLPFNVLIEGMGSDDQEYNCNVHKNLQRVLYTNEEYMNHLSAPMGGWRFDSKAFLPWYDGRIVPLPGPVTLFRYLEYCTKNQLKGYKLFTFFKYYKYKIWKYSCFKKRWEKSLFWASEIKKGEIKIDIRKGFEA